MSASPKLRTKKSKHGHSSVPTGTRGGEGTSSTTDVTGEDGESEETSSIAVITGHEVQFGHTMPSHLDDRSDRKGELDSLVMETGSVDDLLGPDDRSWPTLAEALKKTFKATPSENILAEVCTVYYTHDRQQGEIKKLPGSRPLVKGEVEQTVSFLEKFMNKNGQWDYIRKQDWFTSGDYKIGIDVNYYANRPVNQEEMPGFHKDTGGNNIFVNLIFDNKDPIESTEWFADLSEPSKTRRDWQAGLLPDSFRKALDDSRRSLRDTYGDDEDVRGGISEVPNTYVSWVDDLVWHATPTAKPRINFDASAAATAYDSLDKEAMSYENFVFYSYQFSRWMYGAEILGSMAESGDTELSKWLNEQVPPLSAQDIDVATARRAWQELYTGPDGRDRFVMDAKTRVASNPNWRVTGTQSEANAHDPRLSPTKNSILETPRTLSTRRRVNSVGPERGDPNEQKVSTVRKDNADKPRSFLRTWVRILDANDPDENLPDPNAPQTQTDGKQPKTEEPVDRKTDEVTDQAANNPEVNTDIDQ
ncbi:hypothetical protein [Actinophytocola sp.]|uniref:hypothetical protein n=1 Tax=Actinophytocola sp. TaxID=1872138 RepID=UPI002D5E8CE9|nr:hypothetical protein [Actinophytocola sp.]HYQ66598.1 hypothetical protein [Actinophytocola sp.]